MIHAFKSFRHKDDVVSEWQSQGLGACVAQELGPATVLLSPHADQFLERRDNVMKGTEETRRMFIKILMRSDHGQGVCNTYGTLFKE